MFIEKYLVNIAVRFLSENKGKLNFLNSQNENSKSNFSPKSIKLLKLLIMSIEIIDISIVRGDSIKKLLEKI